MQPSLNARSPPRLSRSHLTHKCDESVVRELVTEAVTIEQEFVCEALSVRAPASPPRGRPHVSQRACVRARIAFRAFTAQMRRLDFSSQVDLVGMNATLMRDYINYVADHLMVSALQCACRAIESTVCHQAWASKSA